MQLPNADQTVFDLREPTNYCLDPFHPTGQHKAVVFRHRLGLTKENADTLLNALLQAALTREAVLGRTDEFGQGRTLDFPILT